ncbi:MAG: ABC transporter substrate-binding protein [Halobacteriales archaeon]
MSQRTTRRGYLRTIGGAATAGLAGCVGSGTGSGGLDEIRLAYMPIYPDMQYFVMSEEGYLDELPVDVTADQFSDGPSIVQASAKGTFDVMMFGVVPAMIVMDKGIPSKITAANIKNAMKILASDEFASMWEQYGKEAFSEFEAEKGRKFKFGTFPPGSVPDILLRYWIESELGLDPETAVEIVGMAGAGPVRQGLLAGQIDGASIMEPVPTIVASKGAPYRSIAWAGDFMPGQPAAVTLMHDRLRKENREIAKDFVEQHIRATQFTEESPDAAATHASEIIGSSLPVDIARKAMRSKASQFISNPHEIESGARIFSRYASRLGKTEKRLSISDMFDYGVYDEVSG